MRVEKLRSNDAVKEEDGIDRRAGREERGVPYAFFPATHTALCALSPTSVNGIIPGWFVEWIIPTSLVCFDDQTARCL